MDASIESMCLPYFDSPSVFARIVDANKGGHFSLNPTWAYKPKQAYAPNSNVLVTKFLSEDGVAMVTDLLVPKKANKSGSQNRGPLHWLIRKVESIRGTVPFRMECAPAFNYCRDKHTTEVRDRTYPKTSAEYQIIDDDSAPNGCANSQKAMFTSSSLSMDLRYLTWSDDTCVKDPEVSLKVQELEGRGLLGPACVSEFELEEGQVVCFVLREAGDFSYSNAEHKRVANPNPERAKTLGVDMQVLVSATTNLRPPLNPIMTKVSHIFERVTADASNYSKI